LPDAPEVDALGEAQPGIDADGGCALTVTVVDRTGFRLRLALDDEGARMSVGDFKSFLAFGVVDGMELLAPGLDASQLVLRSLGQILPDSVMIGAFTTTGELMVELAVKIADDWPAADESSFPGADDGGADDAWRLP
jgi:hypothetical protein